MCGIPAAVRAPSIIPAASSRVISRSFEGSIETRFSRLADAFEAIPQRFLNGGLVRGTNFPNDVEFCYLKACFKEPESVEQLLNRILLTRTPYFVPVNLVG